MTISGLFEVVPGIYQVRGLDLSNITFLEGDRSVVVVDPLISTETAAAALALYRQERGDRPVTGVIYTHSHVDHFGGVRGVTSQDDVDSGACPVLAPAGRVEHAVSENVYAGTAMARRAGYMYGAALTKGPAGQVGAGLGQTTSTGTVTLIPPTVDITETGQVEVVDGIEIEFQLTPGTEAPSEMNFYLPALSALYMAENATHTLPPTSRRGWGSPTGPSVSASTGLGSSPTGRCCPSSRRCSHRSRRASGTGSSAARTATW